MLGIWFMAGLATQAPFVDLCSRTGDPCRLGKPHSFRQTLDRLPDLTHTPLRIAVLVAQRKVKVGGQGQWSYVRNGEAQPIPMGERITVSLENGKLVVPLGKKAGHYAGSLRFEPKPGTHSWIGNRRYRGGIEVLPDPKVPGTVNAVNLVLIEDYLKGVLPSEVMPEWEMEALKAQAIAARSYAIANYGRRQDRGFDLFATVADQVYGGVAGERPRTNQAVDATRWQIMTYQDKPVSAYFHAASGGMTDHIQDIWGFEVPYIRPQPDFDQAAPKYRWNKTVRTSAVERALTRFSLGIGMLANIRVVSRTPGGRAGHVALQGQLGAVTVDAKVLRFALGLPSTKFNVRQEKTGVFRFDGQGWGHGLGLSQWGARQMALDGKNSRDILLHYYAGVRMHTLR